MCVKACPTGAVRFRYGFGDGSKLVEKPKVVLSEANADESVSENTVNENHNDNTKEEK